MGEFFGSLYCIFEDFFGLDLANYLWGASSPQQTSNLYVGIGLWCIFISAIIFFAYYIWPLDHPKLARKVWWWVVFGINVLINFFVGLWWCQRDLDEGKMINFNGDPLPVDVGNCCEFGVTNAIIGCALFLIIVFLFKGFSTNTWHIPYKWLGKYKR